MAAARAGGAAVALAVGTGFAACRMDGGNLRGTKLYYALSFEMSAPR